MCSAARSAWPEGLGGPTPPCVLPHHPGAGEEARTATAVGYRQARSDLLTNEPVVAEDDGARNVHERPLHQLDRRHVEMVCSRVDAPARRHGARETRPPLPV